jgi:hypothetical protein
MSAERRQAIERELLGIERLRLHGVATWDDERRAHMLRRELAQIEHEASPLTTLHPTHAAELAHVQAASAPDKPRRFARAVAVLRSVAAEERDEAQRSDSYARLRGRTPEQRRTFAEMAAEERDCAAECEAAAELLEAAESEER